MSVPVVLAAPGAFIGHDERGVRDVDLVTEDVRDSKGQRNTEDYARRAAEYDPRRGPPRTTVPHRRQHPLPAGVLPSIPSP